MHVSVILSTVGTFLSKGVASLAWGCHPSQAGAVFNIGGSTKGDALEWEFYERGA